MAIEWMDLKDLRELLGQTQAEFANTVGVHQKTIVNWESAGVPTRSEYKITRRFRPELEYLALQRSGETGGVTLDEWRDMTTNEALEASVAFHEADRASQDANENPGSRTALISASLGSFSNLDLLQELIRREEASFVEEVLARAERRGVPVPPSVGGTGNDVEAQHQRDQALAAKKRSKNRGEVNYD